MLFLMIGFLVCIMGLGVVCVLPVFRGDRRWQLNAPGRRAARIFATGGILAILGMVLVGSSGDIQTRTLIRFAVAVAIGTALGFAIKRITRV
jgi:hypothetical protein